MGHSSQASVIHFHPCPAVHWQKKPKLTKKERKHFGFFLIPGNISRETGALKEGRMHTERSTSLKNI